MKKPRCILIRVGELSLKSPQVQRIWFKTLIDNIKTILEENEIKFKIKTNPNRIFIFTKKIKETSDILKKVFGIYSFSPAWTCFSGLNEIQLLATKIAKEVLKLNEGETFAVRARRAGRHRFTSQIIAEEVGAAIKRATGASVNLNNPDKILYVECRSRTTYIFTEKIKSAGGLPIGVSGRVISILKTKKDLAATFLVMKRGCEVVAISEKSKLLNILRRWHLGKPMKVYENLQKIYEVAEKESIEAFVFNNKKKLYKDLIKKGYLVLNPIELFAQEEIGDLLSYMS